MSIITLDYHPLKKGRKWRIDKIHELDLQIERSKELLNKVKDQTARFKQLLNSYHILCERKKESENLNNEISRLESLVSRFENNNEEYLKIKSTIEEEVRVVLIDGKVLLQFALASVFEVLITNPDK
jgi:DNA repair exonuclease SbcCD ATPase subunit